MIDAHGDKGSVLGSPACDLVDSAWNEAMANVFQDHSLRAVEIAEDLERLTVLPRTIQRRIGCALLSLRAISTRLGRAAGMEDLCTDPEQLDLLKQTIDQIEQALSDLNDPDVSEARKAQRAKQVVGDFGRMLVALGSLVSHLPFPLGWYGRALQAIAPEFLLDVSSDADADADADCGFGAGVPAAER